MRLASDWKALERDPQEGVSASPINESNLFSWKACVFGPSESPWEGRTRLERNDNAALGGVFALRLDFPREYPQKPPRVRFTSQMFHPNGTRIHRTR